MYFPGIAIHFSLTLAIGISLCPFIIALAHNNKFYDHASPRKLHTSPIPRIGGVAIFWSGALAYILSTTCFSKHMQPQNQPIQLWPIFLGITCTHTLGVLDDFKSMKASYKLYIQIATALITIIGGFQIRGIEIPIYKSYFNFGILSYPITLLWIVGITNAMNLLDGMDGLAATTGILISMTFAIILASNNEYTGTTLAITLAASLAAFLWFNWNPARIFMGDGGSLAIGYTLACLPLLQSPSGKNIINFPVAVLALAIPITDTLRVITKRVISGRPLMSPDKEHIHHHLLRLGLNQIESLVIISSITLLTCSTTILAINARLTIYTLALLFIFIIAKILNQIKINRKNNTTSPTPIDTPNILDRKIHNTTNTKQPHINTQINAIN